MLQERREWEDIPLDEIGEAKQAGICWQSDFRGGYTLDEIGRDWRGRLLEGRRFPGRDFSPFPVTDTTPLSEIGDGHLSAFFFFFFNTGSAAAASFGYTCRAQRFLEHISRFWTYLFDCWLGSVGSLGCSGQHACASEQGAFWGAGSGYYH
jgi:hypothetical protein